MNFRRTMFKKKLGVYLKTLHNILKLNRKTIYVNIQRKYFETKGMYNIKIQKYK